MPPEITIDDADTALRARRQEAEQLGLRALEQLAELERERDALRERVAKLQEVCEWVMALAMDERWEMHGDHVIFLRDSDARDPVARALLAAGMDWREPKEPTA